MTTLTRREALRIAGLGAVAVAGCPMTAFSQTTAFPKGAVIRTLFKDYAPEELAGGATLFHEHLSLGPISATGFVPLRLLCLRRGENRRRRTLPHRRPRLQDRIPCVMSISWRKSCAPLSATASSA
jgi:hypothetical protein